MSAPERPDYCAPVDRPFTVAHIADPGILNPVRPGGRTRCGIPFLADGDWWIPVGLLAGDRVCEACQAGLPLPAETQEALL